MLSPVPYAVALGCFIFTAITVPLYLCISVTIFLSRKLRNLPFFVLNAVLGVVDVMAITVIYVFQRLPLNGFFPFIDEPSGLSLAFAHTCNSGFTFVKWWQNFIILLVAFSRFTTLAIPLEHPRYWNKSAARTYAIIGFFFSLSLSTLPLVDGPVKYINYNTSIPSIKSMPTACITVDLEGEPSVFWVANVIITSGLTILTGLVSAVLNGYAVVVLFRECSRWMASVSGSTINPRHCAEMKLTLIAAVNTIVLCLNGFVAALILFGVESVQLRFRYL
ncbi:hypothetical protein L596_019410 [Steinernema carpocapsae]|uniref:Serpentine receptor class gamma n=1 Tax=Steinernema carpocapsae TaxID=34508 RepID=A0A4U5MQF9_STECR|nr:hypothetical protein L596_019410 [Steinernema carpocapsae]